MSIGLDIGSHRLRSLRRHGDVLLGRRCRASYAALVDTKAHRRLLQQADIWFAVCEDSLILLDESSIELSQLFNARSLPLFPAGRIPNFDPLCRQMIAVLIESLLPQAQSDGEACFLTVPGSGSVVTANDHRQREFLTRIIELKGYLPQIMHASMAIVFAELVAESFTGIGIALGATSCEVSLAYQGVELAHVTIPHGGDRFDEKLALMKEYFTWNSNGQRFLDTRRANAYKEKLLSSLDQPSSSEEILLASFYRELAMEIVEQAAQTFQQADCRDMLRHPVSVVCCGGTARMPGFQNLFAETLKASQLPFEIRELRVSADDEFITARGCLIGAELESRTGPSVAHAA